MGLLKASKEWLINYNILSTYAKKRTYQKFQRISIKEYISTHINFEQNIKTFNEKTFKF